METKKEMRKRIIEMRSRLPEQYRALKSRQICSSILSSEIYRDSGSVYGYVPFHDEVDIWPVLMNALKDGKKIAVPRICGDDMEFFYISGQEDLEDGFKGIREPKSCTEKAEAKMPLIIAPGVAFTKEGFRMGYGKGFYDKYLSTHPAYAYGVCFEEQIMPEIPVNERDYRLNGIIWA